jgi:hypothetical protein
MTTPGRFTVVARRDGVVRGEWIIWNRSRPNSSEPIGLSGAELMTYADQRSMGAWSWTATEQLDIAWAMVTTAFRGSDWAPVGAGKVALTVGAYAPSGQKRDRAYKALDGTIGQRLRELSDVDSGFDFIVVPTWRSVGAGGVDRTLQFAYPRAGTDLDIVFEMAGAGFGPSTAPTAGGGNILQVTLEEQAAGLASRAYAIGATTNDVTVTGVYQDNSLIDQGWPFMEATASYTTVAEQATINAYARALWTDSQRMQEPVGGSVLADAPPGIGDYALGDTVIIAAEPSINFPDGFHQRVRLLGWTYKPPDAGPETVVLATSLEPG